MAEYQTHEHDVLVIGAGGAGLRAAIEASASGVSVGLAEVVSVTFAVAALPATADCRVRTGEA